MGLLIPEVFIILLTDTIAMLMMLAVLPQSMKIALRWDSDSTSGTQYKLEKTRYLISTIVSYAFSIKIPLFLFYIYTNDKMANVLTGAMCAAGAVNATVYGQWLLYIKIVNIFLISSWLTVSKCNNSFETLPYTKGNYRLLLLLTLLICAEALLSYLNFAGIDPTAVVSCCSSIYSSTSEDISIFSSISPFTAFYAFIAVSLFYLLSIALRRFRLVLAGALLFFFTGCLNLIMFTSTYIYELPSHRCPYCILQPEYGYVGYLFYISLFLSVSTGISMYIKNKLMGKITNFMLVRLFIFTLIYIIASLFYPLRFFIINNVWL